MTMGRNRRFVLRRRPVGRIGPETFELVTDPIQQIGEGEALVRVELLSLDPTMRGWLRDVPGYLPPVQIGEVMRGGGLGRVVKSKHPDYAEGQLVAGLFGWQEWAVLSSGGMVRPVPDIPGVPLTAYLGVLGTTGFTGWFGLEEIARPQPAETMVVSAAAGAVGSVAGQLAKRREVRVVGIAGGADKRALLTERLGFDAAVDHRAGDWRDQLAAATPDGIDVDFENVGGEIMGEVFGRLNIRARVVLCGLISAYNATEPPPGPTNFPLLLTQRVRLQGFIILDHLDRVPEFYAEVAPLVASGELQALETVVDGFEHLPTAINMLYDGTNLGKLLVRVHLD